jgi:hypothetical protein
MGATDRSNPDRKIFASINLPWGTRMRLSSTRSRAGLRRRPLAAGLALALACAGARAGDFLIPVDNCNDSGPGSLRETIASGFNGDHLVLAPDCDTITLTSGPIVIADDSIGLPFTHLDIWNFAGTPVTIDGGGQDRVFVQDAGSNALLTFSNVRITNGRSAESGGCVLAHGNVELSNVEISECAAGTISGDAPTGGTVRGGGLYVAGSATIDGSAITSNRIYENGAPAYGAGVFAGRTLTLTASTIEKNSAHSHFGASYGGGIAAGDPVGGTAASVTIASSTISGNTTESNCNSCGARGGGAWIYGTSTLTGGTISDNHAISTYGYGTGGGLYSIGPATLTGTSVHCNVADDAAGIGAKGGTLSISGATLDCNAASDDGGAIELIGNDLVLTDSAIVANSASNRGGAIFQFGYGDVTTINSTISGNSATHGGAIANTYGSLHLSNSTIAFNTASGHGGAVWFRYAYYPFELTSTIVAGNTAAAAPEDLWPPGMTVGGSHSLVVAAPGVDLPGDTLSEDPLLLPLAANGGATATHALDEGSPTIDAGSNPLALPNDQRGEGFVRSFGEAPDIGAFEVQPEAPPDPIFTDGFDP